MNKSSVAVLAAVFALLGAEAGVAGKVNADQLNMRVGAGLESPVAGRLAKGTEVNILREVGNWLEISAPSALKVYISEARVNPDDTLNGELNLRTGMSTAAPILTVLPKGTKVRRMDERRNGWVRIAAPETVKVYVASFCVDYDKAAFDKDGSIKGEAPKAEAPKTEAPKAETPKAEALKPAPAATGAKTAEAESVTLTGVIAKWKYSDGADTAYALLDAPNGRSLGFLPAEKAAAFDGKTVQLTGRVAGKTKAGALVFQPEKIVEVGAK